MGDDIKKDKLIYEEKDNQFSLNISLSRSKKFLLLQASKTESNETWYLDLESKVFALKCFLKRKTKHLYYIDDTPKNFFILSNKQKQKNFALYKTDLNKTSELNWKIFVSHKKDALIEDFLCFEDFLILVIRKKGLPQLIRVDLKTKKRTLIKFSDKAFTIDLSNNNEYELDIFHLFFSSLKTPPSIFSQDLYTKKEKSYGVKKF